MSLLDSLLDQLGGERLSEMSRAIGADQQSTGRGIEAALPVMLGALSNNARSPEGAASLERALETDHDGGLLEQLSGFLKTGDNVPGDGILRHVFGEKRPQMEAGISRMAGLDLKSVSRLLPMLAPIVMGLLGKKKRSGGLDGGGLRDLLGGERQEVERRSPKARSMLGSLLDSDGDGDFDLGDVKGLFGKLF